MSLTLSQPQQEVDEIVSFLQQTYRQQAKTNGVIAVSGGIDSALSLTLLTNALSPENVYSVLLPYGDQSTVDGMTMVDFLAIPEKNRLVINIQAMVDQAAQLLKIQSSDRVRLGNLMARVRMIVLFDIAKQKNALVCGTENKSEQYLGYFTRFGDEASDIEPIQHLYKTQVRQLAKHLGLPTEIQTKAPSAGLWQDQTDEAELGFSYEMADRVLEQLIDQQHSVDSIMVEGVKSVLIQKVVQQVDRNQFKQRVPYHLER